MDRIRITGGQRLSGTIPISGAKNAALPLIAACLLTDKPLTLNNLPSLADIKTMTRLVETLGVEATGGDVTEENGGRRLTLTAANITETTAPYDLVRTMRASILVMGPLLARYGRAKVSLPGGCAIGTRPVDLHLNAMERLGAEVELEGGYVNVSAPKGLVGNRVTFPKVSVGATENLLMAAALAKGQTIIENAAREPEIGDLVHCLNSMGAKISGKGTDTLTVEGVDELHGADERVIPDRIEAGTYMMAAAITEGDVTLTHVDPTALEAVTSLLRDAGVTVEEGDRTLRIAMTGRVRGVDIETQPYPGFPTDMQAQLMALMARAEGAAMITETIFENRFMHVPELVRMGADVTVHGASSLVRGVDRLVGAPVMATDLRASSSLVIAGLGAEGVTEVNRVYHLDRGYERLEEKLTAVGALVERVSDERTF